MLNGFNKFSGYLALAVSTAALTIAIRSADKEVPQVDYTKINQQFSAMSEKHDAEQAKMREALAAAEQKISEMRLAYDNDKNQPIIVDLAGRPVVIDPIRMYEATKNLPKVSIDDLKAIDPGNVRMGYNPETDQFYYHETASEQSQDLSDGKKPVVRTLAPLEIVD